MGASNSVIVVEDDSGMSQAMARMLRVAGFAPVTFSSAEEFLASGGMPDALCMIIDVQLPGLNGFALHERLTAAGRTPPAIFITAFDEPEHRARAATAGGAGFLAKPFSGHALVELVRRVPNPTRVA